MNTKPIPVSLALKTRNIKYTIISLATLIVLSNIIRLTEPNGNQIRLLTTLTASSIEALLLSLGFQLKKHPNQILKGLGAFSFILAALFPLGLILSWIGISV